MSAPSRDEWFTGVQLAPGTIIIASDGDPYIKTPTNIIWLRDYAQQMIAFLNHRAQRGFTWDDVDMLREEAREEGLEIFPESARLRDLAARIEMILPPRSAT